MANEKFTDLVAQTTPLPGDIFPFITDPAGTPVGKKVTLANLGASLASTGTGDLVRATSPTLVTPALGTPASGVATNLTGTATGLTSGITNALKSATTTVDVSAATAPSANQVLTATDSTHATWQTPAGGSSTPRITRSNIFELAPSTTSSLPYYYTAATGTVTTSSGGWLLSTGTTSGSSVRVTLKQNWTGDGLTGWDRNPEIIFVQSAPNPTTTGDAVMQVTLGDNGSEGTSAGVLTAKHMGFIFGIVSGVVTVWASNANGSTQTKTDVTASWTGGQTGIFRATMTSGTNIKFYIDGVLVATHTTNNPTGALSVTSSIYNDLDAGNTSSNGMEISSYVFSADC